MRAVRAALVRRRDARLRSGQARSEVYGSGGGGTVGICLSGYGSGDTVGLSIWLTGIQYLEISI